MGRTVEFVQLDEREGKQIWWPERVPSRAGERILPNVVFGEVEGLSVILDTVARGVADVAVTIRCQQDERTASLDEAHATAWAAWQARAKSEPSASEPPEMPGAFMVEIPVEISDDAGTRYTLHGRTGPGSGREWKATMRFYPPVPEEARTLTVSIAAADGDQQAHSLTL